MAIRLCRMCASSRPSSSISPSFCSTPTTLSSASASRCVRRHQRTRTSDVHWPCPHAAAPRFRRRASPWATSSCHRGHTATRTSLCANTGRLLSARACAIAPLATGPLRGAGMGREGAVREAASQCVAASQAGAGRARSDEMREEGGRASFGMHRSALGPCRYVSEHLHEWIDLVFGYAQLGTDANGTNARDTHARTLTHTRAHTRTKKPVSGTSRRGLRRSMHSTSSTTCRECLEYRAVPRVFQQIRRAERARRPRRSLRIIAPHITRRLAANAQRRTATHERSTEYGAPANPTVRPLCAVGAATRAR